MPRCDIFISYDHRSAGAPASALYRLLCRYFQRARICIDCDDIRRRRRRSWQLDRALRQSRAVLFLITREWIKRITATNRRDFPIFESDRLLHEIALTLNSGRPFIPVLYDGASIPSGKHLPNALRRLALCSGFTLRGKDNEFQIIELARLISRVSGIAKPLDIDDAIHPVSSPADEEYLHPQAAEPTAEATTRTATSIGAYDLFQESHIREPSVPSFGDLDGLDKARAMDKEAEALWLKGELIKARTLEGKAFRIRYEILGKEHPETLKTLCNLAEMFWAQGDLDKAKVLNKQVLDIRRQTLGDRHADTTASAWHLFLIFTRALDHQGAANVIQQHLIWLKDSDPKELSPEQQRIRDMILQFFS